MSTEMHKHTTLSSVASRLSRCHVTVGVEQ